MTAAAFAGFQKRLRAGTLGAENLPLGPRPVFQISRTARISARTLPATASRPAQ
jgi:hypothetical protein